MQQPIQVHNFIACEITVSVNYRISSRKLCQAVYSMLQGAGDVPSHQGNCSVEM